MSEVETSAAPVPNTMDHEEGLAKFGKALAHASMDICATMLARASDRLEKSPQDPLSCERYVSVANQLSEIAARMYDLAERANITLGRLDGVELPVIYGKEE
jgi:hypothetical protein